MESALQRKYAMHFKFKTIAYDLSNDVEILAKKDINGISIFNIRKQHFSNNPFSIALTAIYSCPNTQTSAFKDCLSYVVGSGFDVLLGDFNIDALDEVAYRRLKDILSSYNLKVLESTQIYGELLDHVYLRKTFERNKSVMSVINNISFWDLDAVKVQLRFRQNSDTDIHFNIRIEILLYCYKGFMNNLIYADGSFMCFLWNWGTKSETSRAWMFTESIFPIFKAL